jgi:hypothetical protein
MVTTPQKSEKLWPSLAGNKNSSTSSPSFFKDDKKLVQVAGNKASPSSKECEASDVESDENECKAPAYKNSLSDALVSALKSASLSENSTASGKKSKKKAKKTLLFSSGMNFN